MFYSMDNVIITYPSNILNYTTEIHEVTHRSNYFCGALTRKSALFYFCFLLLKLKGTQGKLHTQFIRLGVAISYTITMHITGSRKDTLNFRFLQYRCRKEDIRLKWCIWTIQIHRLHTYRPDNRCKIDGYRKRILELTQGLGHAWLCVHIIYTWYM